MAGTIPLSMTQQFNEFGEPLNGGNLFIIVSGTVSDPQDAFQDYALTIPLPYPIPLDAAGRIPQFFLADGTVKIRLEDRFAVTQLAADSVLVIGPPTIIDTDPGTAVAGILQMGDMIARYGVGARSGFARCNGLTIGSEFSGATERANADCQNLFQYLWATDPSLPVIGGRGSSAFSDWSSDKQIALPDWRGRAISGIDDMGGGYSGTLPVAVFPAAASLGGVGGAGSVALASANLPPQTPAGTINLSIGAVTLNITPSGANGSILRATASGIQTGGGSFDTADVTIGINQAASSASFTGTAFAGQVATPLSVVQPTRLCTIYIKL
jgi:hypothetical protein